MPNVRPIHIVRRGNHIEPETGFRTPLSPGSTVRFTLPPGAQGLTIKFTGKSPFGGADNQEVQYGAPLTISRPFDQSDPSANVYSYSCTVTIDDEELRSPGPSGGEIEIVPDSPEA
jgi:hypothetical protein